MLSDDMYAPESVDLLQKSGLEFRQHAEYGISPNSFAELMITSGLVLMPDTRWISFHRFVVAHFKENTVLRPICPTKRLRFWLLH